MRKDPDEALIEKCQSVLETEAEAAFEELFQRYRTRVFHLAFRLLGSESDADDVTQEAFVTVFRKIAGFRGSSRFYTWLYRIVFNLCVDQRRRAAPDRGAGRDAAEPGDLMETLATPDPGPLEQMAAQEDRRQAVERALSRLSPPLRAAIVLRYMEELSYTEIAEVLECSVGTVKSRLSRAHLFLQTTLGTPEQP